MKLTKEDIDKVRHIEGFPISNNEDIIALSNPPYYTACPNPFIDNFIKKYGKPYIEETDEYSREPFAADVSEGKKDPIYNAQSYHTKVPHKAIMRYILHYTEPDDIVFDGFCGTGMTGVAAQMCGDPDADFKFDIENAMPNVKWGTRKSLLSDLSPVASYIAYNYNMPVDSVIFENEAKKIMVECEKECSWMYETNHTAESANNQMEINFINKKGIINYTVWSDVFICPNCGEEIVFWEVAVDKESGNVSNSFNCAKCNVELTKRMCTRAINTTFDNRLGKTVTLTKQVPVLINYSVGSKKFDKIPDEADLALIDKIENMKFDYEFPMDEFPEGDKTSEPIRLGITNVHYIYTKRNLYVLSCFYHWCKVINDKLLTVLISSVQGLSKQQRFRLFSGFPNMILSGTLYVGSLQREWNALNWIRGKMPSIQAAKKKCTKFNTDNFIISTQSLVNISNIPSQTIDYIFTDPPFGDNLMYSELNYIWESWLKVKTNNKSEAIVNKSQNKSFLTYQSLMTECFKSYHNVLKPGRWITVEFHNSKNSIWNAIQAALNSSGFIIADVRILDKK